MAIRTTVKLKKLNQNACVIRRSTEHSAGSDFAYCGEHPVTIYPGEIVKLQTGWSMEVYPGIAVFVLPRSGLSTKHGLRPVNTPGLIDPDYRGEVMIALENRNPAGTQPEIVKYGDYIAQLVFLPFITPYFTITDKLSDTERGENGFGHTEEREG